MVVDIGAALDVLNKTLKPLAYQNLDALPQFKGTLTTTEFLCRYVFDAMAKAAKDGRAGRGRQGPRQDPRHAARDRSGARLVRGTVVSVVMSGDPRSGNLRHSAPVAGDPSHRFAPGVRATLRWARPGSDTRVLRGQRTS